MKDTKCKDCSTRIVLPHFGQVRCRDCRDKRRQFFKDQYHNNRDDWERHSIPRGYDSSGEAE